jgi:hypothetical protein
VVAPRDPPPLYTWEVYPGLYFPAPLPRGNPFRWGPGLALVLALAAAILLGAAGSLAIVGAVTASSGPIEVAGAVVETNGSGGAFVPLAGATVHLAGESGYNRTVLTDLEGRFLFASVPPGGINLNVSFGNLPPAALDLFASPFYSTGGLDHLQVRLSGGPSATSTVEVDSQFVDMEEFLTDVDSGAVLLALGGVATAIGASVARRPDGNIAATAAGAGAAVTPLAFYVLGLFSVFPSLFLSAGLASAFGIVAASVAAMRRVFLGPFEATGASDAPAAPVQRSDPGSSGASDGSGGTSSGWRER